jgi:hypothetical protein
VTIRVTGINELAIWQSSRQHALIAVPNDYLRGIKVMATPALWRQSILLVSISILSCGAAMAQTPTPSPSPSQPAPAAKPADVSSIDAIVAAVYDVISGPANKKRDWDRMRSLFVPGARLIPTGPRQPSGYGTRVLTVDEYITRAQPFMEKEGFFEKESARRSEMFGQIAHIFSTYESRHTADEAKPFQRGINSIQLMNDGTRWWIVTIFWQGEDEKNPLPEKYLKNP